MITALLLAAAVAGQLNDEPVAKKASLGHAPIDKTHVFKANDLAFAGAWDSDAPENQITRAWCFSSVDGIRKAFEWIEGEDDAGVSAQPDGYYPRAGTTVLIKDRMVVTYTKGAELKKLTVVKFRALEGEFDDIDLFTIPGHLFRYEGAPAQPSPTRTSSRKRSGRRPEPAAAPISDAKLVLTDLTTNPYLSGKYVKVDGRVRCTSDVPLKYVKATVSFEDAQGKLVRSVLTFADPSDLASGDIASISVMAESDPRYAKIKIDFKDSDKAIPWVDQSGTNAHQ